MTPKDRAALSKWANRPQTDDKNAVSDRQRSLWTAVNEFCQERGGEIVSQQFASPIRLEVPLDSELPAKLRELGYDPIFTEQTTKIGAPVSGSRGRFRDFNGAYSFRTMNVFLLKLPK
jgi:hypothetical protein